MTQGEIAEQGSKMIITESLGKRESLPEKFCEETN